MKKLWLLVVLALCFALPCAAEEEPTVYTSGDYKYILLEDGTAEIIEYTGNETELSMPTELDGHTVTSIGTFAFEWCENLTSIFLPDDLKSIEAGAFYFCPNLMNVTLPDNLTTIHGTPFIYCEKLTQIFVSPDHPVFAVVEGVLFNKVEKTLITYPCTITASGYSIPHGIEEIGYGSFSYCTNLTGVTIPNSVTTIGEGAFAYCSGITSVTIPDSVSSIRNSAFSDCSGLTGITIPDSVTTIDEYVFSGCNNLNEITVVRGSYAEQWFLEKGYYVKYSEWNCTECGAINNRKFCMECGAVNQVIKPKCDDCGYQFEKGTMPKFCPECGTKQ